MDVEPYISDTHKDEKKDSLSVSAQDDFKKADEHIQRVNKSILKIQEAIIKNKKKGWGNNPLFDEKLRIHNRLNELAKQQEDIAEGIVALLRRTNRLSDVEDDVLPDPPRPKSVGNKA